jgi:Ser/Thr protein kinase RdoA (MazF antagonist)
MDRDIEEALQRLDRLAQDELRVVAPQNLRTVSGEQTHSA